jgi:chromosome segregation ATPase
MARAGVNYIQVSKAAEIIKANGQEPTVDRVREQLGTGSKSTIGPLLKQWKAQHETSEDVSGLPNDLVDTVKSLYERIQQQATSTVDDMSARHNEVINELNKTLVAEKQANNTLTAQNEVLTATVNKNTDELELLRAQSIQYRADKEHTNSTLVDLRQSREEAKRESRAARENLEHYQIRVAEERHNQNQHQQQLAQQLQEQVRQLSTQLSEVNAKLHSQQQLLNEKEKEFHALSSKKQQLENELTNKSVALDELRVKMVASVEYYEQLSVKHESIQKDHDKVVASKLYILNELDILNKNMEHKQSELRTLQDRFSVLDDNYKLALQEKAVIEGQFKQLQHSL